MFGSGFPFVIGADELNDIHPDLGYVAVARGWTFGELLTRARLLDGVR